ncbi:MAG: hypothetical protein ACI9NQ_000430 [Paracoccaceae bacterium]|jgi:hypothetical protein
MRWGWSSFDEEQGDQTWDDDCLKVDFDVGPIHRKRSKRLATGAQIPETPSEIVTLGSLYDLGLAETKIHPSLIDAPGKEPSTS